MLIKYSSKYIKIYFNMKITYVKYTWVFSHRYGFNSDGHEVVYERLSQLPPPGKRNGILGINLGKNKTSEDSLQDYCIGVKKFGPIADYLVVNISR